MFEKPFLSSEWDGFFTFPMIRDSVCELTAETL